MDRNLAIFREMIFHINPISAAEFSGPATISLGFIFIDHHWEITFEEFIRNIGKVRPERMTIRTVTKWLTWNTAKTDLEELEPLIVFIKAREHQMRAR